MASAKASNFSIDHILGFAPEGKTATTSTANAQVSSWIDPVGSLCAKPETFCNCYMVSQKLPAPPHPYLWETPNHFMMNEFCSNDYFGYASFNYPLDQRNFQNGAGSQAKYVYLPAANNPRKRNRMRTVFTVNQTQKLEHLFSVTDYPAAETREELAAKAGLSAETVRVWFKNRRARRRRQGIKGRTSAHAEGGKRDPRGNDDK